MICEGPPGLGVSCPGKKRGVDVTLAHDLQLCSDCKDIRFPSGYSVGYEPNNHNGEPQQITPSRPAPVIQPNFVHLPPLRTVTHGSTAQDQTSTQADQTRSSGSDPVISELLCFVSCNFSTMPYDMLVKLCTDFYSEEDIACAKDILYESVIHTKEQARRRIKR